MGEHLINGQFQSDKYPWCRPNFVPLKITDKLAQPLLWEYANLRRKIDAGFSDDLQEALKLAGFEAEHLRGDADALLKMLKRFDAGLNALPERERFDDGSVSFRIGKREIAALARLRTLLEMMP